MTVQQTRAFTRVARQARPQLDELLLTLGAQFRTVDTCGALERLDDYSRYLFGLTRLHVEGQAGCVSHALRHDIGMQAADGDDPEHMMLDRVLERRRGHPLLLAAVAVELVRRVGATATLCSAPARWFAGLGQVPAIVLVEFGGRVRGLPASEGVRRHCAHEVAFGTLTALQHAYGARARAREADLATRLLRIVHA